MLPIIHSDQICPNALILCADTETTLKISIAGTEMWTGSIDWASAWPLTSWHSDNWLRPWGLLGFWVSAELWVKFGNLKWWRPTSGMAWLEKEAVLTPTRGSSQHTRGRSSVSPGSSWAAAYSLTNLCPGMLPGQLRASVSNLFVRLTAHRNIISLKYVWPCTVWSLFKAQRSRDS